MSRGLLLVVSSWVAWAQADPSADVMLAQVAEVTRTARTWEAAGVRTTTDGSGEAQPREQFKIAYRQEQPFAGRLEMTGGANPLLRVCDGASQWTYYPAKKSYVRVMLPQLGPCVWPINAWPPVRNNMVTPVPAGTDRIAVDGRPRQCQVIRGAFVPAPSWPRGNVLSVCVDAVTKTILRYELRETDPRRRVSTTTFDMIHRDADLDPNLFKFQPPAGSRQSAVINWLDPMIVPETGVLTVSNCVTAPLLISMEPAQPPSAAAQAPKPSLVVLHAEISAEGIPRNIRILRTLGAEWDGKAIEALGKWRFDPAISNGKAVAVATVIAVGF